MAKADIDFEKELWDAANELRGAVSENNYKNYILPLVFLKHLSGKYKAYNNYDSLSIVATIAEVQKHDYNLTPCIYVGTEAKEDDGIPFEEKMEALKTQLLEQFEKSNKLQQVIQDNFNKL